MLLTSLQKFPPFPFESLHDLKIPEEELQLKDLEAANESSETELRSLERWDWD